MTNHSKALIYDGHTSLLVDRSVVKGLEYIGTVVYSPGDGPNGIVYRPCEGVTVEDIRAMVV